MNADLETWEQIRKDFKQEAKSADQRVGLLLGNGASRAVSARFHYGSLYEKACSAEVRHRLSKADQAIFKHMGDMKNFERVLYALWTAKSVCATLGQDTDAITERYEGIKRVLIAAVHAVHIRYSAQLESSLEKIQAALTDYQVIFSTNYDLLLYWAIMLHGARTFKDYFWGQDSLFESTNTVLSGGNLKTVLYLHGGLHLVKLASGRVMKLKAHPGSSLLDQFLESWEDGRTPLFISEGTPQQKLTAINASSYLSFANQKFAAHAGPLVIFGHGLGQGDKHLVDAIKRQPDRPFAISIHGTNDEAEIIRNKLRFQKWFPHARFFAAETHPLGSPELLVHEEREEHPAPALARSHAK